MDQRKRIGVYSYVYTSQTVAYFTFDTLGLPYRGPYTTRRSWPECQPGPAYKRNANEKAATGGGEGVRREGREGQEEAG